MSNFCKLNSGVFSWLNPQRAAVWCVIHSDYICYEKRPNHKFTLFFIIYFCIYFEYSFLLSTSTQVDFFRATSNSTRVDFFGPTSTFTEV